MSRSLILSKDQIEKANKISNSSVKHFKSSMTVSYSQTPKGRSPNRENIEIQEQQEKSEVEGHQSRISENNQLTNSINKQMSEISNNYTVTKALCDELKSEKEELLKKLIKGHSDLTKLQTQRVVLLEKNSGLQTRNNILEKRQEYFEDRIETLTHQNTLLQDEITFEKTINSDLRLEGDKLRNQLNKIYGDLQAYQFLRLEVKGIEKINKGIKGKFTTLEDQLQATRKKLRDFEEAEEREQEERKRIFLRIESLESQNKAYFEKIKELQGEIRLKQKQINQNYSKELNIETNYSNLIKEQNSRITNLVEEVIQLSRKNSNLMDQIDYYKKKLGLIESSNSVFQIQEKLKLKETDFDILFKEIQVELGQVRSRLTMEESQKERISHQLQNEITNSKNRNEEFQIILSLRENQIKNKQSNFENQLEVMRNENDRLKRKIQQMLEMQYKLRNEIVEKDRIIMDYVKK